MEECVRLARSAGEKIAAELGMPVFLYGRAAADPARSTLAVLRRGGLDGLRQRIGQPGWVPDFGPPRLHPTAGAVAVGARSLLVAYNVCLDTDNLAIGREIASATRAANGGPAGTQALAFLLPSSGRVQVSMNLTDVEATTVMDAFRRVAGLAAVHGIRVLSTEIVGLAPRRALAGATADNLQLGDRLEEHVLENRLEAT
jgi:glutamate formiminotransferase